MSFMASGTLFEEYWFHTRILIHRPGIRQWPVHGLEISPSARESPQNVRLRHRMTTLTHARGNALEGEPRGGDAQEDDFEVVAGGFEPLLTDSGKSTVRVSVYTRTGRCLYASRLAQRRRSQCHRARRTQGRRVPGGTQSVRRHRPQPRFEYARVDNTGAFFRAGRYPLFGKS